MSLRDRCHRVLSSLHCKRGFHSSELEVEELDRLEAFAKQEQIKGMEAAKMILQAHHSRVWITEQIDAAIKQLKEGG